MNFRDDLEQKLGLKSVAYKYNLPKVQLFHEAIENDRGRLRVGGPDTQQKAFPTKLGVDGPLTCRGPGCCTAPRSGCAQPVSRPVSVVSAPNTCSSSTMC